MEIITIDKFYQDIFVGIEKNGVNAQRIEVSGGQAI
jgi:hypothetical protein